LILPQALKNNLKYQTRMQKPHAGVDHHLVWTMMNKEDALNRASPQQSCQFS
jgi:hypothetical protein